MLTSKHYAAVRPRTREIETQLLLKFQGLIDRYEAASIAITIAVIEGKLPYDTGVIEHRRHGPRDVGPLR